MPDRPRRTLDCRGRRLVLGERLLLFGIVNVTPDSFYDGGRYAGTDAAVAHAERLAGEGADAIDVGGQSTRPGPHEEISAHEEIARVRPVVERLAARLSVPISIDTFRPEVARAALEAGAHLVNDVHGFQREPEMARVVAEHRCPAIVMHFDPAFSGAAGDAMARVRGYFARSLAIAAEAGVAPDQIVLDPGIGFAKTADESLELIGRIGELRELGFPLLLGASRKSPIGRILGVPPEERLEGTLATTVLAALQGVDFVRVHDVLANLRAARVAEAILARSRPATAPPAAAGAGAS